MRGSQSSGTSAKALARFGVAVFAFALFVPAISYHASSLGTEALIATSGDPGRDVTLPNKVATLGRQIVVAPAPAPAAEPAPAVVESGNPGNPGDLVTASWYGPGFYENRLPCWQWLQASGLPIQLLPETWGVAHKTLPCGTMLTLTHGAITITVPVVDRGPYILGRELDLSPRVRSALGCTDLCTVVMQID